MEPVYLIQIIGYFSSFIPLVAVLYFLYQKRFSLDTKVNLMCVYIVFYSIIQNSMMVLAVNGIHNAFLLHIYLPIEVFLFGYFTLSLQISSNKVSLSFSILLSLIILLIDIIWGKLNEMPVESLMVEAIVITIIGMAAIPSIKIRKDYESSYFYFTFGILFSSVNILLGIGFIDLAPELSYNIQSFVTIITHLIFAWGFYIIIKSESKVEKTTN